MITTASQFLEQFVNRPGFWTFDGLERAVQAVLGEQWRLLQPVLDTGALEEAYFGQEYPVLLLPARTGADWYQTFVLANRARREQVVHLRGRVRLPGHGNRPNHDSILLIGYPPGCGEPQYYTLDLGKPMLAEPMFQSYARSHVMDLGVQTVLVTVQGCQVTVHDERLARKVESGAYSVTLRPADQPPLI